MWMWERRKCCAVSINIEFRLFWTKEIPPIRSLVTLMNENAACSIVVAGTVLPWLCVTLPRRVRFCTPLVMEVWKAEPSYVPAWNYTSVLDVKQVEMVCRQFSIVVHSVPKPYAWQVVALRTMVTVLTAVVPCTRTKAAIASCRSIHPTKSIVPTNCRE